MSGRPSPFASILALLAVEEARRPAPGGRPPRPAPSTSIGRRADAALATAATDRDLARPASHWLALLCPYVGDACQAAGCAAWQPVDLPGRRPGGLELAADEPEPSGYCCRVLAARRIARGQA